MRVFHACAQCIPHFKEPNASRSAGHRGHGGADGLLQEQMFSPALRMIRLGVRPVRTGRRVVLVVRAANTSMADERQLVF